MTENTKNPTTQQIDRDLAEKVMGWRLHGQHFDGWCFIRSNNSLDGVLVGDSRTGHSCWSPSASRDNCAEVLAKVTDSWQRGAVLGHLETAVKPGRKFDERMSNDVWLLLTAAPDQIAEAVWGATCQG